MSKKQGHSIRVWQQDSDGKISTGRMNKYFLDGVELGWVTKFTLDSPADGFNRVTLELLVHEVVVNYYE